MNRSNEILRLLLDADDSEEADLVKSVAGRSEAELDVQLAQMLPELVKAKEAYLKKPNTRISIDTNPHGQTFCYGEFGRGRASVTATLAYIDPEKGWVRDNWHGVMEAEEGEFKELFGGTPRPRYIPFGTLVHNTLAEEHLIPAFLDAIESIAPEEAEELRFNHAEEINLGDPEFCWETLLDALNRHVPPYSFFGAHIGNSSDFGVWPSEEAIFEASKDRPEELQTVKEGEPLPSGSKYVAVQNRDGFTIALIDGGTGEEIWRYE